MNDVPVVLLNPANEHDMGSWFVGDYPHIATDSEQLVQLGQEALEDPKQFLQLANPFIENSFGSEVRTGAKKAANIVRDIITTH